MKQCYGLKMLLSFCLAVAIIPAMAQATGDNVTASEYDLEATRAVCPVPCADGIREIVTNISDGICVIDSKIDNIDMIFTGTVIIDLDSTFTVLQEVINEIRSCCDTLIDDFNETWTILGGVNSRIDAISFSGTYTVLNAIQNQIATCCDTLVRDFNQTWTILGGTNSRLDAISFNGTYTMLNAIQNEIASCCDSLTVDFNETWTILGGINSRLDAISFNGTYTMLNDIQAEVASCCDSLTADFNETWTILGGINSRLDGISFNGTYTMLNAIQNEVASCCDSLTVDFNETWTILGGINSRLDGISFNGTYTMLNAIQSEVASCCDSLTVDFNETWTILGGINSRLDGISFNGTYTMLNAIQNEVASCCDSLTVDFNETWTILGDIASRVDAISFNGTYTVLNAIQDELASCCDSLTADFNETWTILGGINSRLDNLSFGSSSTCDLSGTFTVLNALQNQLASCCDSLKVDFQETWTILAALAGCAADVILIHQADLPYTITTAGYYCVVEDLSGVPTLITIDVSNVVLDLNGKNLSAGLTGISVPDGASNVTIKNGYLIGMSQFGINISGGTDLWIKDCHVVAGVGTDFVGFNFASSSKAVLENCSASDANSASTALGFFLSEFSNFTLINCHADLNIAPTSEGFQLSNGSDSTLKCCTANGNRATGVTGAGFACFALTRCRFDYCSANNNGTPASNGFGFNLISLLHNDFYHCEAIGNSGGGGGVAGFTISGGDPISQGNTFEGCISSANTGAGGGFGFLFTNDHNSKLYKCTAIDNSGSGFSLSSGTAGIDVRENTALGNGVGFDETPTTHANLFYANFACNNVGSNYTIDPAFYPIKHPNIAEEYDNVSCNALPTGPTTRDLVISCCDLMVSDFNQTWTILGDASAVSVPATSIMDTARVDAESLSITEWLKTIYRQIRLHENTLNVNGAFL